MSEELRMFYQTEGKFDKNLSKEELMKNVFVKAYQLGRDVGYSVGYNSGLSQKESFDECLDDSLGQDDIETSSSSIESWDTCDELLNG